MARHGTESYFVVGEGFVGAPRDVRGLAAASAVPPFHFSRLRPGKNPNQLDQPTRKKVAAAMTADNASPGTIPAGYTYLGQFLDHDLTFDKTTVMEGADVSPATLLQSLSLTESLSKPSSTLSSLPLRYSL